jgi:hypothetical protein
MLHLKGTILKGSDNVTLTYWNTQEYKTREGSGSRVTLIDVFAKPSVESDIIRISAELREGGPVADYTLRKVFEPYVKVSTVYERLKRHNVSLGKKIEITSNVPEWGYDQTTLMFHLTLPPYFGVYTEDPMMWSLFGMDPEALSPLNEEEPTLMGWFNDSESPLRIDAVEMAMPNMPFREQLESMYSPGTLEDRELPTDIKFTIVFGPPGDLKNASRQFRAMETTENVIENLIPLIRELEERLHLRPGLLQLEPLPNQRFQLFLKTERSYPLTMRFLFSRAAVRLLACPEEILFDFRTPRRSDRKRVGMEGGPIAKLGENILQQYYPLVLTSLGAPHTSYIAHEGGKSNTVAYLDGEGTIYAHSIPLEESYGNLVIHFRRRDLSRCYFDTELNIFMHFQLHE